MQVEPYRQGGENGHELQLCVGTTYPPLVLQRGLSDVTLWDWHQEVIAGRVPWLAGVNNFRTEDVAAAAVAVSARAVWSSGGSHSRQCGARMRCTLPPS